MRRFVVFIVGLWCVCMGGNAAAQSGVNFGGPCGNSSAANCQSLSTAAAPAEGREELLRVAESNVMSPQAAQKYTRYGKAGSGTEHHTKIGGAPVGGCGPPNYCAYRGTDIAHLPSVPDMGGVLKNGRLFYDRSLPSPSPSPVARCTDQATEPNLTIGNQSKSAGLGGSGSAEQLFNTNSTLLRFNTSGNQGHITLFNPATLVCGDPVSGHTITADKNTTNPGSASSGYNFGAGSFSWTDPQVYFGFGGGNDAPANGVAKYRIDTATGNFTVEAPYLDFANGVPIGKLAPVWQPNHAYATGDYVSYTIPLGDWSGTAAYVQGDLILPLTSNPLNCAFKLSRTGTRGTQPGPWSLTTDVSCVTGQTKTEGGGTAVWRNIGNSGAFTYQLTSGGGTSGNQAPNFATASGHPDLLSTVSDGTLTWTNTGTMVAPRWRSFAGVSKDSNRFCSAFSSNAYGHPSHYDLDNGGQGTGIYVGCYDFALNEFVLLNTATGIQSRTSCADGTGYACSGGTLSKLTALGSAYKAITENCAFEIHNAKGGSTLDFVVVAKQGNLRGTCSGKNLLSWQPFAGAVQDGSGPSVSSMLFGAHYNQTASKYPAVAPLALNVIRLWDTRTGWADLQADANCSHTVTTGCNFAQLDSWLAKFSAASPQPKIILTLGKTPPFIAANNSDTNCGYTSAFGSPNGTCTPPTDVNCDGSGSDATWIQFITALWDHLAATGNLGKIGYLEIWNEWNVPKFWDMPYINGTRCASTPNAAQKILVRLEQDARCVLKTAGTTTCHPQGTYPVKGAEPGVQILSSPLSSPGANNVRISSGGSEDQYLSAGGGAYADALSIHGYIFSEAQAQPSCGSAPGNANCAWPENVGTMLTQLKALEASQGLNLPIMVSEGSWGGDSNTTDAQYEQAFMGRYMALLAQYGAANFNWYNADDAGNPGTGDTTQLFANVSTATLTPGGIAYQTMEQWLSGKKFSAPACTVTAQPSCSGGATSHIYECGLTSGEKLVWYDEVANDASCAYRPTGGFTAYRTIDGGSGSISGASITLDNRPILLEPFSENNLQIYNALSSHWTIGKKLFVNVGDQSQLGYSSGAYTALLDSANPTLAPKTSWQVGPPFTSGCELEVVWYPGDAKLPCNFAQAYDSHTAFWHGPADDDTGPVCGTMYNYATLAPDPVAAYQGEEVCISTQPNWNLGDPVGRYKVWRFTHTFATGGNGFFDTQFAISQLSQDGKFLAFSSDWNCTLGSTAGTADSLCGPPWVGGTNYVAGQMINPFGATTGSGTNYGVYQVTTGGVASSTRPAWFVCNSSTAGNMVTDSNGVVYTCLGSNNGKGEVFVVGLR